MKIFVVIILYITVFSSETRYSRIYIEENGYRDIIIALPENIQELRRASVIRAVQDLMESSSIALYVAMKRRAYFRSVTFLIPESWNTTGRDFLNQTILLTNGGVESRNWADLIVSDVLQRQHPYTLQAEGCGQQGKRIYLPLEFLFSDMAIKDKGVEFVHYWAQYRYGVYSEGGFRNDDLYPLYYSIPGTTDIRITACSNPSVEYNFTNDLDLPCIPEINNITGKPELEDCIPKFDGQTLRSSLMYQQALPNVHEFCDSSKSLEKSHNPSTPSKHNILCSEESPGFVILRNRDFIKGRNQATRYKVPNLTFNYVQESYLRIVIAIDISSIMGEKGLYFVVKNALNKFILIDLPLKCEIAVVSFHDVVVSAPAQMSSLMSDEDKTDFLESKWIPETTDSTSTSCIDCALNKSLELLQDDYKNGLIILLTTTTTVSVADVLKMSFQSQRIRLSVISFPDEDGQFHDNSQLSRLAISSEGIVFAIPRNDDQPYAKLYLAFSQIIEHPSYYSMVLMEEIIPGNEGIELTFHVDTSVSSDFLLFLSGSNFQAANSPFKEDETYLISPDGELLLLQKQYNIPALMYRTPRAKVGTFIFRAKWKESASEKVLVTAGGKAPKNDTSISVQVWTDSTIVSVDDLKPVKLFAEVSLSVHPIINVQVVATIFGPDGDFVTSFPLLDNGYGDPDITLNDGVFTRYIPPLNYQGCYNVIVEVTANDNHSRILHMTSNYCCGSFVAAEKTVPNSQFKRIVGPISLFISNGTLKGDLQPPNRITDLHVSNIDIDSRIYTFQWHTAGDDYDHGMASSYRIKIFLDRSEALRSFDKSGYHLDYNRDIVEFGQDGFKQKYVVRIPDTFDTGVYYVAVKAIDDADNASPVSNIIQIFFTNKYRTWTIVCDKGNSSNTLIFALHKYSYLILWCFLSFLLKRRL